MPITAKDIEGVVCNLYAKDGLSLFADTGLSTPATSAVNGWKDTSLVATNHALSTGGGAAALGTLNGFTAVAFNGSTSALLTPSFLTSISNAFSIYLVSQGPTASSISYSDSAGAFFLNKSLGGTTTNYTANILTSTFAGAYSDAVIDSWAWDSAHRRVRINQVRSSWRRDLTGSVAGFRDATVAGATALSLSGKLIVGAYTSTPSFFANTTIGQLIVLNRFLDDVAEGELLKSLSMDWAINTKPYVICCGDSLTVGASLNAGESWPELIQTSVGSTWDVERYGYPGRFLYQALQEFPRLMSWAVWPEASGNKEVAVIFFGANEASDGITFTQQQYLALVRSFAQRGCRIVCCTCTPRTTLGDDGSAFEAFRSLLNPFIRSLSQYGIPIADLAANATMGAAGAQNNATYYQGDKIHYTAAGNVIIASIVQPAVTQALLGSSSNRLSLGLGLSLSL